MMKVAINKMAILTIEIDRKEYDELHGYGDTSQKVHHMEIDQQNAKITKTYCRYDCNCNASKSISEPPNLIEINDEYEDDDEFIRQIKKVVKQNIHVKIFKLLRDDNTEKIRELIQNMDKDDDKITSEYPYVTTFGKTDREYTAILHIPDHVDTKRLYVTVNETSDEPTCCHSRSYGTYREIVPVNFSIGPPSNMCPDFEPHTKSYNYVKNIYDYNKYDYKTVFYY